MPAKSLRHRQKLGQRVTDTAQKPRSPEEVAFAQKCYFDYLQSFEKGRLSNAEAYDKAILTYSTGALALSLGFLKDNATAGTGSHFWILVTSWACFVVSIISIILSYLFAVSGNKKALKAVERYYIHGDDSAADEPTNIFSRMVGITAWVAGLLFCAGAALTACFVVYSIEENTMSTNSNNDKSSGGQPAHKAAGEPAVTRLPTNPVPTTTAPTPTQGTQNNQSEGGGKQGGGKSE